MRSAFGLFAFAAAAACTQPAPAPPAVPSVDTAAVSQAVGDLWTRISAAVLADNYEAFSAEYATDVRIDAQGFPAILSRAALDSLARPMFAARHYTAYTPMPHTTVVVSNDLVLQGGTYTETYVENKKTSTEYGRFAGSIGRTDSQWRFLYLMLIVDSTVAAR